MYLNLKNKDFDGAALRAEEEEAIQREKTKSWKFSYATPILTFTPELQSLNRRESRFCRQQPLSVN